MPNTPSWPGLLRNEIDSVNPVISKLSNEMANFDKRVAALDNSTLRYLGSLDKLTRVFSGINLITQPLFKNYEGYLNVVDSLSRKNIIYGRGLNDLEKRITSLSKATSLSRIEISQLQQVSEQGLLGRRFYSQIDETIKRVNNFAASAKQAAAVYSDLVQIQGRFGNQLGSLRGLGAAELSSLSRDQFMSAIQTQFMGGGRADTKQRSQIREQERFKRDYENRILRQGETLLPTGQALGRGAQRVGGIFGENQQGLIGMAAGSASVGGIASMATSLFQPWAYMDLRKRMQGQGPSAGGAGGGLGNLTNLMMNISGKTALPVYVMNSWASRQGFNPSSTSATTSGTGGGGGGGGTGTGTTVIPGSGPMSMKGRIGRGVGAATTAAAMAAGYYYAPTIDEKLKGGGYIQGSMQGGIAGATPGMSLAGMGLMTGQPWLTGIGLATAVAGGGYGAYKGYKGVEEKKEQTVQSEKLLGLETQIQNELLKTQVNEEKITALMKEYNSLVDDVSKHMNVNVAILGTIYDRVQAIMKFQERSVGLVDQLASAYGQISSTYETQLLVGSKAEKFSREQIKTSLERVRIERAGYEEQLRLNEELNSRIASGDRTALQAQQDLQKEFEKTHGFDIASLEAKAKLTTFYSQERDLQAKNLALATKTADVQGQVQNIFTQQAVQVERLSQATRIGMHASYAATLNVAQAMTQELRIQERGYVDIASDILRINTEMNKLRESGIKSVEKKERLQGLMEDKDRQELRLIEQQNKMLGTQSGIMEKLLSIKQAYVEALPEISMGMDFEASFDVTRASGGPLFMAPNMFVGGTMGGGMRYAGYGHGPMGGMGGAGAPSPWAYGGFGPGTQQFGNAASRPIPSAAAQRAFGGYSMGFASGGRVPDSDGGMLAILHSNDKAVITDQQAQRLGLTDEVLANVGKVPGFSGSGSGIPSFEGGVSFGPGGSRSEFNWAMEEIAKSDLRDELLESIGNFKKSEDNKFKVSKPVDKTQLRTGMTGWNINSWRIRQARNQGPKLANSALMNQFLESRPRVVVGIPIESYENRMKKAKAAGEFAAPSSVQQAHMDRAMYIEQLSRDIKKRKGEDYYTSKSKFGRNLYSSEFGVATTIPFHEQSIEPMRRPSEYATSLMENVGPISRIIDRYKMRPQYASTPNILIGVDSEGSITLKNTVKTATATSAMAGSNNFVAPFVSKGDL